MEWKLGCGHTVTGRFMRVTDDDGNEKTMCMECYEKYKKNNK